nr:hypothetical protein [Nitrosomonas nitrosa]
MSENKTPKDGQAQGKIHFYYEKAKQFRVIHADGVHGGLTPRMNIHMAVFSERNPIPQRETYLLGQDNILSREEKDLRVQKEGFFREVEADIVFSIDTARVVSKWLADRVEDAERALKETHK